MRSAICAFMRFCLLLNIRYNNFDMSERKTPKELEGLKQEIEKDEQHLKELLEKIVSLRKTLKKKYKELRKLYPSIEKKQKKYWDEYVMHYERKKTGIPMKRNFYDGIIKHLRQKRIEDTEIKGLLRMLSQESEEE
jgi:dsDNA-specific endonuclease/ATPase MutS2